MAHKSSRGGLLGQRKSSFSARTHDGRMAKPFAEVFLSVSLGFGRNPTIRLTGPPFVRTKAWQLESIVNRGDAISVAMFTKSDASTKQWWPADFRLIHRATFGPELLLELEMTNTGSTSVRFQEALHTYHKVGHVNMTRLHGLDKVHYLDNTDSNREKVQEERTSLSFPRRTART